MERNETSTWVRNEAARKHINARRLAIADGYVDNVCTLKHIKQEGAYGYGAMIVTFKR